MSSPRPIKNNDLKQHEFDQQEQHVVSPFSSESKSQEESGFHFNIWNGTNKVIEDIILDYSLEPTRLGKNLTLLWTPSLKQEILSLAYHAMPFEKVENYSRKTHAKKERHLPDTLVEATIEAIKNGDVTLKDEKGNVLKDAKGNIIAEGLAERLMELHDELYPEDMKCIDKIRSKLSIEDKDDRAIREKANEEKIRQVFEAIKKNDQNTNAEIEKFKKFIKSTSPINRIHLLFVTMNVLERRGDELPSIEEEKYGQRWGKLADRLCFEIIGDGIQRDLPPRIQQLLKTGLYYVLNSTRVVERELDVDGLGFYGLHGSDSELGVNAYYDDVARGGQMGGEYVGSRYGGVARDFEAYYRHFYSSIHELLYSEQSITLSYR